MKTVRQIAAERGRVRACDEDFFCRLRAMADAVGQTEDLHVATLTGPTCSGKTTAAAMLTARLDALGKKAHIVSIDDFYYDTDRLRRMSVEKGLDGIDYDSVDTIDLAALRTFTEEIVSASVVHAPIFDFRHGKRTGFREMRIGKEDVFIFEGIQAAYPEVTALFGGVPFAGMYIAPETAIETATRVYEPNELRLLRRIVRDYLFRKTAPEFTFALWKNVRQNEEAHIFPYVGNCQYRVDSTMAYELGVLKPFLERILSEVPKDSPYRATSDAILSSLADVEVIPADWIESDSLFREFI